MLVAVQFAGRPVGVSRASFENESVVASAGPEPWLVTDAVTVAVVPAATGAGVASR